MGEGRKMYNMHTMNDMEGKGKREVICNID